MVETSGGATGGGNSITPSNSLFITSNTDRALNVGALSNYIQRNAISMGGSFDVTTDAMIAREIEKGKIREEILTYGYLRRRELEDEVIREMMIAGELAARRAKGGSLLNSPYLSVQSGLQGLISNRRETRDGLGFDDRLAYLLEGGISSRLPLANRLEGGNDGRVLLANRVEEMVDGLRPFGNRLDDVIDGRQSVINNRPEGTVVDGLPFRPQPGGTGGVACKQVIDLRKEPANSTATPNSLQANNTATNAGSKRKLETQTIGNDDGATLASSGKKSQKVWSCELCQVSVTSEKGMREHLNGKKHKTKEKAVHRTTKSVEKGSNESDIQVEETDKSSELAISGTTGENLSDIVGVNQGVNNVEACSHKQQHAETNAGFGLGKKHERELKNEDTDFKFWCKMCEVGTTSEALMTAHWEGKQHMSLLKKRGGGVIAIKTMPDDVQYVDVIGNTPVNMEKEAVLGNNDGQGGVGVDELENADKSGVGADEPENADKCPEESH